MAILLNSCITSNVFENKSFKRGDLVRNFDFLLRMAGHPNFEAILISVQIFHLTNSCSVWDI